MDYAGGAASRFHKDDASRDRSLNRRRADRPPVFQTGTRFVVSSGRIHHVAHLRDHSALYLDKIYGGLTKFAAFVDLVRVKRQTVPFDFSLDTAGLASAVSSPSVRPRPHC